MNSPRTIRSNAPSFARGLTRLEDRCTPASLYVDDTFLITDDVGPAGLSPGDVVTFAPGFAGRQVTGLVFGTDAFDTIQNAIAKASNGDTIEIAPGKYLESGQVVVNKDLVFFGSNNFGQTVISPTQNTTSFTGNDDARGFFLVASGKVADFYLLTFDGRADEGLAISQMLRHNGDGVIDTVEFQNFGSAPAVTNVGMGLAVTAGNVTVNASKFSNFDRIGILAQNNDTVVRITNSTFIGRGDGEFVQYGVQGFNGITGTILGNVFSDFSGIAFDGSSSSGLLLLTLDGFDSTVATVKNNAFVNNNAGLIVGPDGANPTIVNAQFNNFLGNTNEALTNFSKLKIDASGSYWNSPTGPTTETNPGGKGDVLFDDSVIFRPFQLVENSVTDRLRPGDSPNIVTAPGAGGPPLVSVINKATGEVLAKFLAFDEAFRGGVRIAQGDVTGDGVFDILVAAGPGGGPNVRVFDGTTFKLIEGPLGDFFAFDPAFTGGVFVATADVTGDGVFDIITAAGAGGGPNVRVFNGATGKIAAGPIGDFFAFDPAFTGGVSVAANDFDSDNFADVVVAAGPGGGPNIRVFDGATAKIDLDFFAYDAAFTGGVFVAAGDVTGDGIADIIAGAGPGGGPNVRVFDGSAPNPAVARVADFFAYAAAFTGGARIAVNDLNNDARVDIVTGAGPGGGPHVLGFDSIDRKILLSVFPYDPTLASGIFVG